MVVHITAEKLIEAADAVVQEFGADYVYENPIKMMALLTPGVNNPAENYDGASCLYVHGDKPGCLIAQIAYRLGATVDQMNYWDGVGGVQDLLRQDLIDSNPIVTRAMSDGQACQDQGRAWGEVVEQMKHFLDKR